MKRIHIASVQMESVASDNRVNLAEMERDTRSVRFDQ